MKLGTIFQWLSRAVSAPQAAALALATCGTVALLNPSASAIEFDGIYRRIGIGYSCGYHVAECCPSLPTAHNMYGPLCAQAGLAGPYMYYPYGACTWDPWGLPYRNGKAMRHACKSCKPYNYGYGFGYGNTVGVGWGFPGPYGLPGRVPEFEQGGPGGYGFGYGPGMVGGYGSDGGPQGYEEGQIIEESETVQPMPESPSPAIEAQPMPSQDDAAQVAPRRGRYVVQPVPAQRADYQSEYAEPAPQPAPRTAKGIKLRPTTQPAKKKTGPSRGGYSQR